jgi:murein DD-endopeptidase MepM/ murein hydrolase activator NlpD
VTALEFLTRSHAAANAAATQRRRAVFATGVALLAGCAVAAFAIAPLAPDAAALPVRLQSETVLTEAIEPQVEALETREFDLSRCDVTRATDSAAMLLARLGVADPSAVEFMRRDGAARLLFEGRGGSLVQARIGADGRLIGLIARSPVRRGEQVFTHFVRLTVARSGEGPWQATEETVALQAQPRLAGGAIRTSLFAASDEARIPDAIAVQIAEIFSADIDMHRELRSGDTFSVVYEGLTADGEPIPWASQGSGRVLAAEFVNGGKTHQAVWYRNADGRGGYFDLQGQSKRREFLASPMEFSRVSSSFAMRLHPIEQSWRAHLGVDYAAPVGTAVRSVGDGVVELAGQQNGYGNVIQVRHANERSTLYAHLSRIDVKKGQRVEQGQRIGTVGATGWATGPHLHFEFRVNGRHQDPLRMARASEAVTIAPAAHAEFDVLAQDRGVQLAVAQTLVGARGHAE